MSEFDYPFSLMVLATMSASEYDKVSIRTSLMSSVVETSLDLLHFYLYYMIETNFFRIFHKLIS